MKKPISIKNIILAVAGALGMIATFLPWASTSILGITIMAKGTDGNGWISFIAFAAVLGLAVFNMFKDVKWTKIAVTVAAVIAIIIAVVNLADVLGEGYSIGFGLILAIIAGIASVVTPWLPIDKRQASTKK